MGHRIFAALLLLIVARSTLAQQSKPLTIEWEKNLLSIQHLTLCGLDVEVNQIVHGFGDIEEWMRCDVGRGSPDID